MKDNTVRAFNAWGFIGSLQWRTYRPVVCSYLGQNWSILKEHEYYVTADGLHLGLGSFSSAMALNAMMA